MNAGDGIQGCNLMVLNWSHVSKRSLHGKKLCKEHLHYQQAIQMQKVAETQ